MEAASFTFDEIPIGYEFSFEHFLSDEDIRKFSELTGDFNPLHVNSDFAKTTRFGGRIAQGMLAASFFSTSVGMYCPGKYAVIVSQEIDYLKPVRPDSHLEIIGKVIRKIESVRILIIEHTLVDGNHQTLVRGTSKVKVMK